MNRTLASPDGDSALPKLGEVLEFMSLIWRIDHALQRRSKRMEAVLGVTGPQRLVMRIVGRFPGITAGNLARLLHIHPSTLTGILKRLLQQGLIHRRADPRDARRTLLSLTPEGRRLDVDTEGTIESALQRILDGASPAQIDSTRELLSAISNALSDFHVVDSPRSSSSEAGPIARSQPAASKRR